MNTLLNRFFWAWLLIPAASAAWLLVSTGQPGWLLLPLVPVAGAWIWQQPRYGLYGLLLSIPFSIEYSVSGQLSTDLPDEPLMWGVSLLVLMALAGTRKSLRALLVHPLAVLLFLGWAWALVSAILSPQLLLSMKFVVAKVWYLLAFVVAPLCWLQEKKHIRTAGALLAGSMALAALIALWRHAQQGFSFATVNEAVTPFFRNHVNYSALLVLTIPVWLLNIRRKNWLLLLPVLLLLAAALYFSYARGAWLAALAGLAGWWLLHRGWLFRAFLAGMLATLLLFFWLRHQDRYLQYAHDYRTTIYHTEFAEHLVATYKLKDVSTAERFYRWIAAIRMSADRPLTGVGPNRFPETYKPWAVPAFRTWVSDNPEKSTVHNYFLLLLAEQGWPGLILWVLLLGAAFYFAQLYYRKATDPFYRKLAALLGIWLIMLTVLNFLSDLVETDKVGSVFFLCIAGLLWLDFHQRKTATVSPAHEGRPAGRFPAD